MTSLLVGVPIIVVVLLAILALVIHFLPTVIAWRRDVENFWWIFLINFFFGFTVIGWVIPLIWALRDRPRYRFQ